MRSGLSLTQPTQPPPPGFFSSPGWGWGVGPGLTPPGSGGFRKRKEGRAGTQMSRAREISVEALLIGAGQRTTLPLRRGMSQRLKKPLPGGGRTSLGKRMLFLSHQPFPPLSPLISRPLKTGARSHPSKSFCRASQGIGFGHGGVGGGG